MRFSAGTSPELTLTMLANAKPARKSIPWFGEGQPEHPGGPLNTAAATSVAKLIGVALTFVTRVATAGPAVAVIVAVPAEANVVMTVESSVAPAATFAIAESLEVHVTLSWTSR